MNRVSQNINILVPKLKCLLVNAHSEVYFCLVLNKGRRHLYNRRYSGLNCLEEAIPNIYIFAPFWQHIDIFENIQQKSIACKQDHQRGM